MDSYEKFKFRTELLFPSANHIWARLLNEKPAKQEERSLTKKVTVDHETEKRT
jgi:hypothetical protein